MQLISARQAWHDAYNPKIKSTTALGMDALQLGISVERTLKNISTYQAIHAWLAGKVQHNICLLPSALQNFGHYLYSPISIKRDLEISHELVWLIFQSQLNRYWTDKEQQQAYWLIRAVLKDYKGLVISNKAPLALPNKIIQFMAKEYAIKFERKHWKKKW